MSESHLLDELYQIVLGLVTPRSVGRGHLHLFLESPEKRGKHLEEEEGGGIVQEVRGAARRGAKEWLKPHAALR